MKKMGHVYLMRIGYWLWEQEVLPAESSRMPIPADVGGANRRGLVCY